MEDYIIIKKSVLQKKIDNMDATEDPNWNGAGCYQDTLREVINLGQPLQPFIETVYEAGKLDAKLSLSFDNPKSRYISHLKLDI